MITTGPIEVFFKPPQEPHSSQGDCLLFHLRRDLEELYGKEGDPSAISAHHVLLATMGTLAGIDYLSQVYSTGGRRTFVETLEQLVLADKDCCEALYQLRCALMHKIELSVVSDSYLKGTTFNFELTDDASEPLIRLLSSSASERAYSVGVWQLKKGFKKIIDELLRICSADGHPKTAHVINMIGQMHVQKILKS